MIEGESMRIRGSLEQAICIVLLISTSSRPVKSSELSKKLNVSDSYLKKIMRQLVKAKIVSSIASKNGGFVLLKTPSRITFLDLFNAIEGQEQFAVSTSLVDRVFDSRKQVKEKEEKITGSGRIRRFFGFAFLICLKNNVFVLGCLLLEIGRASCRERV